MSLRRRNAVFKPSRQLPCDKGFLAIVDAQDLEILDWFSTQHAARGTENVVPNRKPRSG
jgi:hypothetical protein